VCIAPYPIHQNRELNRREVVDHILVTVLYDARCLAVNYILEVSIAWTPNKHESAEVVTVCALGARTERS